MDLDFTLILFGDPTGLDMGASEVAGVGSSGSLSISATL